MASVASSFDLRLADDRLRTTTDWLDSAHSFSFGQAYDPDNTHFGLLLVSNEDVVAPDSGFDTHPHRDMEIVTWVIAGSLVHQDSEGNNGAVYPGLAQRMSAGTGILHSERNDTASAVHFVQMWVSPDETGIQPGYEQLEVDEWLAAGSLVPIASGLTRHRNDTAIRIRQQDAGLCAARLSDGGELALPAAPYVHVFVTYGSVVVEAPAGDGPDLLAMRAGDALRVRAADGQRLTAVGPTEVLVWEMHRSLL